MTLSTDMHSSAREFYDRDDPARWGRCEMPQQRQDTARWLPMAQETGIILELGCGRGALALDTDRYVGIDLSVGALGSSIHSSHRIAADMQELPIADSSVAFAFSWAALEHVPSPEFVLKEIERVLRPSGIALLAPAWHCRTWAAEGLESRRYDELAFGQRIRKALIPLRNSLMWRAPAEGVRRLIRELMMSRGKAVRFRYKKLNPNLDEYAGTDSDAFSSLDPHAMIVYFLSRGWQVLSHPTAKARMLARSEPVVVRKPAAP